MQTVEADSILQSDPSVPLLNHFDVSELAELREASDRLKEYLDDEDAVSISSIGSDELDGDDCVYLADVPEETVAQLGKVRDDPRISS